eukprot:TRINITY_DN1674_c0_g1_i1.p1 TRINITY_DN1674_c0_g1~~TRINITY_DN1674_c0_g1_i1.p1  ORF type:complete len:415 (-),score=66.52 TRINITY_DN1674_c0_g1_i1:133-1377(-)
MGSKVSSLSTHVRYKDKKLKDLNTLENIHLVSLFTKLEYVDLHKNKLAEIPEKVCIDMKKNANLVEYLVEVDLSFNRIKQLPDAFFVLINLRRLNVSNNQLGEFNPKLCLFYRLESLDLSHNRIFQIPWNISRMRQLKSLKLGDNSIDYLPNTLGKLKRLQEMVLTPNPLRKISPEVRKNFFVSEKGTVGFTGGQMDILEDPADFGGIMKALKSQDIPLIYRDELMQDMKLRSEIRSKIYVGESLLLRKVLRNPRGKELMLEQMKKEHAEENFLFWVRIQQFRSKYCSDEPIKCKELIAEAEDIFKEFISDKSKFTVNLSASVKSELVKLFTDSYRFPAGIDQFVFNTSFREINILMSRDIFHRFRISPEGKELVDKAQQQLDQENASVELGMLTCGRNLNSIVSSTTSDLLLL